MEYFYLSEKMTLIAPKGVFNGLVKKLWFSFSNNFSKIKVKEESEDFVLRFGNAKTPKLEDGDEFAVNVEKGGFIVIAKDKCSLLRGYFSLLSQMENKPDESKLLTVIEIKEYHGKFCTENRLVDLCYLPGKHSFLLLKKYIRLSAFLGYKQCIFELAGKMKQPFINVKSSKYILKKWQLKVLIKEANKMGMQVIPGVEMFGHAAMASVSGGKHTFLSKNPKLAPFFTPDGWVFNIRNPEIYSFLKAIREKVYKFFYQKDFKEQLIHIGFDEPYIMNTGYCSVEEICDFYKHVIKDVLDEGYTPMIWGDMMINEEELNIVHEKDGWYYAPSKIAKEIRAVVDKRAIICDWQYDNELKAPVKSSLKLKEEGFTVYGCPWGQKSWFNGNSVKAHVETTKQGGNDGIIVTTWDGWNRNDNIVYGAYLMGYPKNSWSDFANPDTIIAAYTRKLLPTKGHFDKDGWHHAVI